MGFRKSVDKNMILDGKVLLYSGDPEIGPPIGLTESCGILESVRFVKPVTFEWRDTSLALLRVDMKVNY